MSMSQNARETFINNYRALTVKTWVDEALAERFKSDPRAVLAESGIELPADAKVSVQDGPTADTTEGASSALVEQADHYEEGLKTGSFVFYLASAPNIQVEDLDAAELEGMAAGACCSCCCCCG